MSEAALCKLWRSRRRGGKSGGLESRRKKLSNAGLPTAFGACTRHLRRRAAVSRRVRGKCVIAKRLVSSSGVCAGAGGM